MNTKINETDDVMPSNEKRFKENLLDLISYINSLVSNIRDIGRTDINSGLFGLATVYVKNSDEKDLLSKYIKYSFPFWDRIHERDEIFFRDNCHTVFSVLPFKDIGIYVDKLRDIFDMKDDNGKRYITPEHMNSIWAFVESFVKISIKQVHIMRGPTIKISPDGSKKPFYTKEYCPELPVDQFIQHAKKWSVSLVFK